MLFSVILFGCIHVVLTTLMVLTAQPYLATRNSIVAAHVGPRRGYEATQLISRHRDGHQNQERMNHKGGEDTISLLHPSEFLNITRGGGINTKTDDLANENHSSATISTSKYEHIRDDVVSSRSTIISIGVLDLSGTRPNITSLFSSIILLIEGETATGDVMVDETLLRTNILPLFENKPNDASIEISAENINIILESFTLICDVLVVRIDEEEILTPELMSYVIRANRERKLTGMAVGKLWLCTTKRHEQGLQRVNSKSYIEGYGDDDHDVDESRCHSGTATWSVLFPSANDKNRNTEQVNEPLIPSPKKLFTSFSQQLIQFKLRSVRKTVAQMSSKSTFQLFPKVSVLYRSKQSCTQNRDKSSTRYVKKSDERSMRATDEQRDNEETIGDIIGMAYRQLGGLEEKMQELVLDEYSNPMPLLEFGEVVQNTLQTIETQLKSKKKVPHSFGKGVMKKITAEVERLYKDQLQALRNYYGQRYESILDADLENIDDDDETIERKWAIGAEHLTQAFLAAAFNSVPAMYRTDLKESNDGIGYRSEASFDHVDVLQGLIRDMMESTERRKDERNLAIMLVSNDNKDSKGSAFTSISLPKIPKWMERLAARVFVFGVNYIQGWLAWQGIKRAAIERDRNQPKFPLF